MAKFPGAPSLIAIVDSLFLKTERKCDRALRIAWLATYIVHQVNKELNTNRLDIDIIEFKFSKIWLDLIDFKEFQAKRYKKKSYNLIYLWGEKENGGTQR